VFDPGKPFKVSSIFVSKTTNNRFYLPLIRLLALPAIAERAL
jgi:hypothetical protein